MSDPVVSQDEQTLLSYFLKTVPYGSLPTNAQPQTLHPYASSPGDPTAILKDVIKATGALSNALHSYVNTAVSEHKLVSILRQSTALINSLHNSERDSRQRIERLRERSKKSALDYGEPIPLDDGQVAEWCISRIEEWGRSVGMECYRDEERGGRMTVMFGGKVLVIEVDLYIDRGSKNSSVPRMSVASVKTSHALPSGSSGNALAERSKSLDASILESWNRYLAEVQSNDPEKSHRAAYLAEDIQNSLRYLMKLDMLASKEGDQGIRWFNDTGLLSSVTEQVMRRELESLSVSMQVPKVSLDVFLARAHVLAVPYLLAPSTTFLIFVSPLGYYTLLRASSSEPTQNRIQNEGSEAFSKLDVSISALRSLLAQRNSQGIGVSFATLSLMPTSTLSTSTQSHADPPPRLGRPFFRLPGTSPLAVLDHTFITPPDPDTLDSHVRDAWVLDFTNGGRSPGIVMSYSRMCEIRQVLEPGSAIGGNLGLSMHISPLPGSWLASLINPTHPPSERYGANYISPADKHPRLRLRLTAPNEAGFLLEKVPVSSLKEVYGVLEVVRDQCWLNEMVKTLDWVAEDLLSEDIEESSSDNTVATEEELNALLNGTHITRRIPVNVYLPPEPPALAYGGMGLDSDADAENAVPGLSSISMSASTTLAVPCIVLLFAIQSFSSPSGPCQVAMVVRHERSRRRGVRIDVNFTPTDGNSVGYHASPQLTDELEECVRRGGLFALPGMVWTWASSRAA